MELSPELIEEIHILTLFSPESSQSGIKVHHHTARPEAVSAVERLFEKGLLTHRDGGYLTSAGQIASEHVQAMLASLQVPANS